MLGVVTALLVPRLDPDFMQDRARKKPELLDPLVHLLNASKSLIQGPAWSLGAAFIDLEI